MAGPLLGSKLHRPDQRAGAVRRPRLSERLGRVGRPRLTLICAPAGFGKTTLLAQWLDEISKTSLSGGPAVAWVSLDLRDNDPTTFWTYVITAVQQVTNSSVGESALGLLLPPQPRPEAALTTLLNDLDGWAGDVLLVLDDYHLIEERQVHDGMSFLLDHLPRQLQVVLATRADPPLPVARLRARGELAEVRAGDLRFTRAEAADYLAGPMGLTLAAADVTTLAERTEGWAAALQLAALSLQNRDDPGAVVARFAGNDRFIVDYLVDEVLARQPADVREFLLATSVLDRLAGPLCDAVTGQSGGAGRLSELERAGLFLIPLDDGRQWWRYHHLFADVLRAHLGERHPDRVAELHRRASDWLQANGAVTEAVAHALAGDDVERAADLMEFAMPMMQRERREPELARWVRELPDEVLRQRPVLGVAFVGALAQASDFRTAEDRLSVIEHQLRPDGGPWPDRPPPGVRVVDEAGFRAVPAGVETYRAALSLIRGDLDGTATHARTALSLAPDDGDLVRAAAGALGGLAAWTAGDLAGALAAYTASIAGLARVGFVADVLGCSITVGDIRRTQGRLGAALEAYRKALELATTSGGAPVRGSADMHVGIAGVLYERDDLAAAAEHLQICERLGDYNGLPQNPYRWRIVAARLREADGDLDAALELLDEADRVYNGDYSPNVRPVPATRARLQLRRGEVDAAERWAREQGLSADDDLSYLREYEHVTLARVHLARYAADGDRAVLTAAAGLLDRLRIAAEAGGRDGSVLEVLVLQATAHLAAGDRPAAADVLRRAVALAEPEAYVRTFADEGPSLAVLLDVLARERPSSGYLRRLVAASPRTGRPVPETRSELLDPLSDRELTVLRLLASDLDGPEIARRLHVSLNTMRTHSRNIFRKLQVNSRRAAVSRAAELGLLSGARDR